jgi:sugar phosphate isomerase/epimerase
MDRRDFLKKSALGIAGAVVGGSVIGSLAVSATGCDPASPKKRIGLQLWSVREAMNQDPKATLESLARMGYSEVETASYDNGKVYGFAPAEFRAMAEAAGLKVTSCHIGGGRQLDDAWWTQAIADHKAMGCKYIVVPSFGMPATVEEMKAVCDYFNRVGAMCAAAGLVFGYHNHSFEFKTLDDGQVLYDYMIQNTTADVAFQMDMFWVKEGGGDPVAYLNKYAGRFPVLHIKDDDIIGASGKIDFEPIFNAAYAQGMQDYYVEVEKYPLPAEVCVQKSFDFLEVAPYVK